jgi:hypothetical protein
MLPNQSKPLNISIQSAQAHNLRQLTNSCSGIYRVDEDDGSASLGSTVGVHADISPDDLSSLSHKILQILPRGLDGELISALYGERGELLTLPTNKFLLGGATPFWPRKFRASPVARPIFPGMGGAPNRAVSSRS